MDKLETRRLQLIALVKALGHGGIAHVAGKIDKEPSYVSRMTYEPGKPGKKPVTEASADRLDLEFPGWMDDAAAAAARANPGANESKSRPGQPAVFGRKRGDLPSIDIAFESIAQWVSQVDDLTRDQIRPLVNRLFDEPHRGAEIAARIAATLQSAARLPTLLTSKENPQVQTAPRPLGAPIAPEHLPALQKLSHEAEDHANGKNQQRRRATAD